MTSGTGCFIAVMATVVVKGLTAISFPQLVTPHIMMLDRQHRTSAARVRAVSCKLHITSLITSQLILHIKLGGGRSKSYRPDLVMFRIKLKYYLLLILARLRTQHAQYDFWAINILCILAYEHSVCQMVSKMLTPNCPQVSELFKRYRRDPAKIYFRTCYSGWNVHPQLRFWVRTTKHAMERTNWSKLSFHYTA